MSCRYTKGKVSMAASRNILVRTLATYVFGFVLSIFFVAVILPLLIFPPTIRHRNRFFFLITSLWSKLILKVAGIPVIVRQGAVSKTPVVYVMNHASAIDIICVETLLGGAPRIWLGKHEYDKTPILNWILRRMHVLVDAQSPTHAARALKVIQKQAVAHSAHVLLFPEGARFDDGQIHRFFKGFSILAEALDRDVVPVYIHNAHRVYSKNSFLIMSNEQLSVTIGEPIVHRKGQSHEEFTAHVREWFLEQKGT